MLRTVNFHASIATIRDGSISRKRLGISDIPFQMTVEEARSLAFALNEWAQNVEIDTLRLSPRQFDNGQYRYVVVRTNEGECFRITPAAYAEMMTFVKDTKYIEAIKFLRMCVVGLGLKDAKEAMENCRDHELIIDKG